MPNDCAGAGADGGPGTLRALARHASAYSVGSLLVTLASVVSFPLFTRLFTVGEYGVLGLVNVTLGLLVGIGKLGLQKSIVRFHAEIEAGQRRGDRVTLFSTVLFGMLGVGILIVAGTVPTVLALPGGIWGETDARHLLVLAAPLVLVRVVDSAMLNLVNAEQRSAFYSVVTVIRKYLGLALVAAVLLLVRRGLVAFFVATTVAEALAVLWLVGHFARQGLFDVRYVSPALFMAMLGFGLPLLASELSSVLLTMGGRYIILARLGARPLGSYSAAYNFCDYLQGILTLAFSQAVVPIYLRIWEQQGREATERFLGQVVRYYAMLALPVLGGLAAVGPELLRLLASDRYGVSAPLFGFIVGGMLLAGGAPLFSAGIYIDKLTRVVMWAVLGAALVNIGLTAALVGPLGIEGAALATLVSYIMFAVVTAVRGRRVVHVRVPWLDVARYAAMTLAMFLAVRAIRAHAGAYPDASAVLVALQCAAGVAIYAGMLAATEPLLRRRLIRAAQSLRSGQRPSTR